MCILKPPPLASREHPGQPKTLSYSRNLPSQPNSEHSQSVSQGGNPSLKVANDRTSEETDHLSALILINRSINGPTRRGRAHHHHTYASPLSKHVIFPIFFKTKVSLEISFGQSLFHTYIYICVCVYKRVSQTRPGPHKIPV